MKLHNKKTGDIDDFILYDDIDVYTGEHWIGVKRTISHRDMTNSWHFQTLKELYDTFEDYAPKEPLIKDEKARKSEPKVGDIIGVVRYGGEYKPIYYFDELCGSEE